ncbi:MAG: TraB/GumN family protein [Cryomorphaceae bacterium]|nr:TraB/GumN family protein [Cryomorphaceae bacterium]
MKCIDMKMRKTLSLLLVFLLGSTLYAQDGLVWKISGKDLKQPSYLFGTMHIICAEDYVEFDQLENLFNEISTLFLETDISDMKKVLAVQAKMVDPEAAVYYDEMDPHKYRELDAFLRERQGVGMEVFKNVKPIFLMSQISGLLFECEELKSYEMELVKKSKANDIPIKELETLEFQMSLLDKMSYAEQMNDLNELLNDLEASRSMLLSMVNLYKQQNLGGLAKLIYSEEPTFFQEFEEEFLGKRNLAWLPIIMKNIQNKSCLFAVGAAHLAGEDGLIELLKREGYKVEQYN